MKHFKFTFLISVFLLILVSLSTAQQTVPVSFGIGKNENAPVLQQGTLPQYLLDQLNNPETNRNQELRLQVGRQVDEFLNAGAPEDRFGITQTSTITSNFNNPPFTPDWYGADVQVHSGSIATSGYRQIDLKQGEDGWMYLAINKFGTPGSLSIYFSSNGGATWPNVINYGTGTGYIHNISMLVESRNNNVLDSTRLLVYFTFSQAANGDNAGLYVLNVKRTGSGGVVYPVADPSGGNKLEYVSACSDGMYYDAATYMHVAVREATNAGTQVGIRHLRSINFGVTHTNSLIVTNNDDYYPAAAFSRENGTNDSIYIATERRLSSTQYELRMLTTYEVPNTNHKVYYITSAVSGVKYEKPAITIVQQNNNIPRKILVTCTRNRNPRFNYSANSGSTWVIDQLMGTSSILTADYTTCNSDSLTSGGQNVIMGFVTDDGDSVNVKQLTIPPTTTFSYYKRNSHVSTGFVAPSTAIYKSGSIKNAAFAYCGSGPVNVYYNAEHLLTGIQPVNNTIPGKFLLNQNYPNPFNPVTNVEFSIPKSGIVKLVVFDALGKEVAQLVNGQYNAGTYKVDFNASGLASGVYFYKIETPGFSDIKKMMLIK